jgi:hypothetical protein
VLFTIGRWHQQVDIPPEDLAFAVAEKALRTAIKRFDSPVRIDDDDRVDGRFDDRPPARLAGAEPVFEFEALVVVHDGNARTYIAAGRSSLNFSMRYRI